MLKEKTITLFKHRRDNKIRYSANKIFISGAELQHTNSELLITLYTYNKQKLFFGKYIQDLLTLINLKKRVNTKVLTANYQNTVVHTLKEKFFMFKK